MSQKTDPIDKSLTKWTGDDAVEIQQRIRNDIDAIREHNPIVARTLHMNNSLMLAFWFRQDKLLRQRETALREELLACIDESVGDQTEYWHAELKDRIDKVLNRHSKEIERINEWRDLFTDNP